jgi:hypothetical protein
MPKYQIFPDLEPRRSRLAREPLAHWSGRDRLIMVCYWLVIILVWSFLDVDRLYGDFRKRAEMSGFERSC